MQVCTLIKMTAAIVEDNCWVGQVYELIAGVDETGYK
jgi:hypothetical protein